MKEFSFLILFSPLFLLLSCTSTPSEVMPTTTQVAPTSMALVPIATETMQPIPTSLPTMAPSPTNQPTRLIQSLPISATASTSSTALLPIVLADTNTPTAVPPLSIQQFEIVQIEELNPGKRITFQWTVVGAGEICLVSGTARRLAPWWGHLPTQDTLTVEIRATLYRDPAFTLQAYASGSNICEVPAASTNSEERAIEAIVVVWPCAIDYFFVPAPQRCPLNPATTSAAADQPFEHGRLIWLESENAIFVFYDDGRFEKYPNTWQPGQPESDPAIIPPEGLYQPVRGFGQVWREQPGVREQLGWALTPEQGYTTQHQFEHHEGSSSGAPAYLQNSNNQVLWYFGEYSGSWGLGLP